jgi:hypothetical protein
LIDCTLQKLPRGQALSSRPPPVRSQSLISHSTILTILTIHAPDRWLVLRLLLQVARPHTASLPLARSLRRPGCLGDAVARLPLRFALDFHRARFEAAVYSCCCRLRASPLCPRPEPGKAWLFGRRSRPLSLRPSINLFSALRLRRRPCPTPWLSASPSQPHLPLASPSTCLRHQALSGLIPP